jgi:ABC-type transport system substrate-binding protein
LPAADHGHGELRLAVGGGVIGFDVSRPPFHDRRGRLALVLATDRERLADVTLRGHPVLGAELVFLSVHWPPVQREKLTS